MEVKAIQRGYYGDQIREPDDVFDMDPKVYEGKDGKHPASWVVPVAPAPKARATVKSKVREEE